MNDLGPFLAGIEISLYRKRIFRGNVCVRPDSAVQQVPGVSRAFAVRFRQGAMIEILRENAITRVSPNGSAISRRAICLPFGAATACDQTALSVRGPLGPHVDDSVYGVAPQIVAPGPRITSI